VTPLGYGQVLAHFDWVKDAIQNSPDGNFLDEFLLGVHDSLGDFNPKDDVVGR